MGGELEVNPRDCCCNCCGLGTENLTLTLENIAGCGDLDGVTGTMVWDAVDSRWEVTLSLPNCSETWDIALRCQLPHVPPRPQWQDFVLVLISAEAQCDQGLEVGPASGSCDPFELVFDLSGCTETGCCGAGGDEEYRVRITE